MIVEYIAKNKERIANPKPGEKIIPLSLLHFHIGQLMTEQGSAKYEQAIHYFRQSFNDSSPSWNAYVSATIAFLEKNKSPIIEAITFVEFATEPGRNFGNLGILKNFLKGLETEVYDYVTVYRWPRT